jgi:hypothetical protein
MSVRLGIFGVRALPSLAGAPSRGAEKVTRGYTPGPNDRAAFTARSAVAAARHTPRAQMQFWIDLMKEQRMLNRPVDAATLLAQP